MIGSLKAFTSHEPMGSFRNTATIILICVLHALAATQLNAQQTEASKETRTRVARLLAEHLRLVQENDINVPKVRAVLERNRRFFIQKKFKKVEQALATLTPAERRLLLLELKLLDERRNIEKIRAAQKALKAQTKTSTLPQEQERSIEIKDSVHLRKALSDYNAAIFLLEYARAASLIRSAVSDVHIRVDGFGRPLPVEPHKAREGHIKLNYYRGVLRDGKSSRRLIQFVSMVRLNNGDPSEIFRRYNQLITADELQQARTYADEHIPPELQRFDGKGRPVTIELGLKPKDPIFSAFPGLEREVDTRIQNREQLVAAQEKAIQKRISKYNFLIAEKNFSAALRYGKAKLTKSLVETDTNGHPLIIGSFSLRDSHEGIKMSAQVAKSNKGFTLSRVTAVHEREASKLYEITVEGIPEPITGTPEHPIFIFGKRWVPLGEVRVGDLGMNRHGKAVRILSKKYIELDKPVKVYNLTVEGNHNYLVGSNGGLLVHNADNYGDPEALARRRAEALERKRIEKIRTQTASHHDGGFLKGLANFWDGVEHFFGDRPNDFKEAFEDLKSGNDDVRAAALSFLNSGTTLQDHERAQVKLHLHYSELGNQLTDLQVRFNLERLRPHSVAMAVEQGDGVAYMTPFEREAIRRDFVGHGAPGRLVDDIRINRGYFGGNAVARVAWYTPGTIDDYSINRTARAQSTLASGSVDEEQFFRYRSRVIAHEMFHTYQWDRDYWETWNETARTDAKARQNYKNSPNLQKTYSFSDYRIIHKYSNMSNLTVKSLFKNPNGKERPYTNEGAAYFYENSVFDKNFHN